MGKNMENNIGNNLGKDMKNNNGNDIISIVFLLGGRTILEVRRISPGGLRELWRTAVSFRGQDSLVPWAGNVPVSSGREVRDSKICQVDPQLRAGKRPKATSEFTESQF
jgi:hypothetical protein